MFQTTFAMNFAGPNAKSPKQKRLQNKFREGVRRTMTSMQAMHITHHLDPYCILLPLHHRVPRLVDPNSQFGP